MEYQVRYNQGSLRHWTMIDAYSPAEAAELIAQAIISNHGPYAKQYEITSVYDTSYNGRINESVMDLRFGALQRINAKLQGVVS